LLKQQQGKAENTSLDTREKIVPVDRLPSMLGATDWVVVVGLFDPLTAVEARRLADLASGNRKLLAIVLDSEDALLSVNARAELVAALREVNLVASAKPERWRSILPIAANLQIVEDPEGDKARSAEFVQFVMNRQESVAAGARRKS
jgi:hypothetical protein